MITASLCFIENCHFAAVILSFLSSLHFDAFVKSSVLRATTAVWVQEEIRDCHGGEREGGGADRDCVHN